jgi:tRNA (guanine37-N1)-methyltransferase
MTWKVTVLTLFPEMFPGPLDISLVGQARAKNIWSLDVRDIREHAIGKHRSVDDTPAGGGPGMVMRADVAAAAIDAARESHDGRRTLYLSARGTPLDQQRVRALSEGAGALLICGRFEGLDQRVIEARNVEEVSLGDFVLAGGEIAAMAVIEACVRLLPGVLGNAASPRDESFARGLLEYPQYTRPIEFEGRPIPEVLFSGHHAEIARWRREQAENLTKERRPDLWTHYERRRG